MDIIERNGQIMSTTQRPGVYTSYEVSGVRSLGTSVGTVGVAAVTATGTEDQVYTITTYASAVTTFGASCAMTELIRILLLNGVAVVKAVPVYSADMHGGTGNPSADDYAGAFDLLAKTEDIRVIICDSDSTAVHTAMKESIAGADERYAYRIGIVESVGTVEEIIAAAQAINHERMVMAAPGALDAAGENAVTGSVAAAMAGVIMSESDPAVPLNGAYLAGIVDLQNKYDDGDITALVEGGVTPIESSGGAISVVRGITTRSLTNGASDSTWRELNTVLIVDNIIPEVRDTLKAMFSRAKNTAQTRAAIRTQVMIVLEKKLAAEIIDSYGNIAVTRNASDSTVCDVSFEFTVTHGLNQVQLVAYITV